MAMSWTKIQYTTPEKPEIFRLSRLLTITPEKAFLLCVRFWCWCDANLSDGKCPFFVREELDTIVKQDGFAEALRQVGWLDIRGDNMTIPNYERHLGKNSKVRAKDADRKAKHREKQPF